MSRKDGRLMGTTIPNDMLDTLDRIHGWLWRNEILALYRLADLAAQQLQPGEVLLEIGSYQGKSTAAISYACKNRHTGVLYAVDPFEKLYTASRKNRRVIAEMKNARRALRRNIARLGLSKYVKHIDRSSEAAFGKYRSLRTRFIFIDGDHSYRETAKDFRTWESTLVPGGYLILHDTVNHAGPRTVFHEVLLNPRYVYIGTTGDAACFRKETRLSPRNWAKKLLGFLAFRLFFSVYIPTVD